MRFTGRCYRAHGPKWSFSPLSGAGAAKTGGRFNRKGEPALYLSLDIKTAIGESTQGLTRRLHPLTIVEYDVDCAPVADLRTEKGRKARKVKWDELSCAWLTCLRSGKDAPSWRVADRLKSRGFAGMLVPGFFPGASQDNCNLVLWRWAPDLPARVTAFDPGGRLPRNQLSWS